MRDAPLGVHDGCALSDVQLRNDFEHFEDRLWQHYVVEGHPDAYFGRNVGAKASHALVDGEQPPIFHHFDPYAGEITFWEHRVDMNDLTDEIEHLRTAIYDSPKVR